MFKMEFPNSLGGVEFSEKCRDITAAENLMEIVEIGVNIL